MTREDVLSGVKFRFKGMTLQAHIDPTFPNSGSLTSYLGHEANVESWDRNTFRWYTYAMGKRVSGRVRYDSLEAYVDAR